MSTEGSVSTSSSGIRQFGLYRTIDARTEEFLRLSRKRQIRQGCACAAISTAITVTVVITMILIYEYSIIHESNSKISLKQNWLSLMNKSAEAIPFEAKLNKAKINFDPMYVQFLPLILKTLKKNKYFDKILEDDSTQTPNNGGENQDDSYTKNIFSDSGSWMRMPTSRLFTIEYKTSPIVYFKYPTRNIDHFTKIRRIRDYQRVMNYVDKMISDKVAFTSTIPMLKNTYSFYKKPALVTYASTTPMTKLLDNVSKTQTKDEKSKKKGLRTGSTNIKNKSACRCPKRISQLLSKLIKCLQKIIPDFVGSEKMSACNENKLKTNESVTKELQHTSSTLRSEEPMKIESSDELISTMISKDYIQNDRIISKFNKNSEISVPLTGTVDNPKIQVISTVKNYHAVIPNTISKTFYSVKPLYPKLDYTLSSIINLLKPHLINHSEIQLASKEKSYTTTTQQYIEGIDAKYYLPESTTRPISKETSTKASSKIDTTKAMTSFSTFSDTEYADYTTPDVVNDFKVLDVHSLQLAKNGVLVATDEKKHWKGETQTTHPSLEPTYFTKQEYNDTWKILRKMGKLAFSLAKNNTHETNTTLSSTTSIKHMTVTENIDSSHSSMKSHSQLSVNKPEEQLKNEDVTLEEETDNANYSEEVIVEDNLKNLENLLNRLNVSEIFNSTLKKTTENETSKLDQYGRTQVGKHADTGCQHSKSMIPENRPSYLEIHRNDWKRDDEHHDYDNTVYNNYFP